MRRKRTCLIQFILVLGLIATVLLSLNSGYSQTGLADLWGAITDSVKDAVAKNHIGRFMRYGTGSVWLHFADRDR